MSELLKIPNPIQNAYQSSGKKKTQNSPLSLFSFKNSLTADLNLKIVLLSGT